MKKYLLIFFLVISFSALAQTTVTIRPDSVSNYSACIGLYAALDYENQNFKHFYELIGKALTVGSTCSVARSLFRFDLSNIPTNAVVSSAMLSLYFHPGSVNGPQIGVNSSYLQRITSYWDQNFVTWNTQPTTTSTHQITLATSSSTTQDYLNNDVTLMVQDMISDPCNSYGFELKLLNESCDKLMTFCASNYPDSIKRPVLVITYTVPGSISNVISFQQGIGTSNNALLGNWTPGNYATMNFGQNPELLAKAKTVSSNCSVARGMFAFDYSSLPSNAIIDSAFLSLYYNPNSVNGTHFGANSFYLQRITDPWNQLGVTWNTQPSTTTTNEVTVPASTSGTQDYPHIDVTQLVTDMIDFPSNSFGFEVKLVDETCDRMVVLCSPSHPDACKRPKLEIFYHLNTSVEVAEYDFSVSVFPNPAGEELSVISYQLLVNTVEIFDVLGRRVERLLRPDDYIGSRNDITVINVSSLASGIYTVRVSEGKNFAVKKFVKI